MPCSFIREAQTRPARYRTPSPPVDAFEPLFPDTYEDTQEKTLRVASHWANNDNETSIGCKRPCNSQSQDGYNVLGDHQPSGGTMDAFASIALATKPNSIYTSQISFNSLGSNRYHIEEPPAKRTRSEKLPSPDWQRKRKTSDERPTTSYEQLPESRRLEAELLVNFAQVAARITTPSPIMSKANTNHLRRPSEMSMLPPPTPTATHISYGKQKYIKDARPEDAEELQAPPFSPISNPAIDDQLTASESESRHDMDTITADTVSNVLERQADTAAQVRPIPLATSPDISKSSDQESDTRPALPELGFNNEHGSGPAEFHDLPPLESSVPDGSVRAQKQEVLEEQTMVNVQTEAQVDTAPSLGEALHFMEDILQKQVFCQVPIGNIPFEENPGDQNSDNVSENESRVMHGALASSTTPVHGPSTTSSTFAEQTVCDLNSKYNNDDDGDDDDNADAQPSSAMATAVCAACKFARNSIAIEKDENSTSWISCDACKDWFHFACAGFKNEREVRAVDKFRCRKCKPIHGATTYVRKSSRAHSAIDYAGLHQGVIKTSDESPEHHYIKPIKDGTITFLPENFARMRPELVTAEYFEKGIGMKEPVVIPACFNPQPRSRDAEDGENSGASDETRPNPLDDSQLAEEWFSRHEDFEMLPDHGQDALDMVIPQGLTVRRVCELYGPEEKVEVIDVKSQNGENKKWNMRRWADYYENPNNKVVRNVISLEVSQSKLGRLIRRPKIVRDLDLQDSVWPQDLRAKGEYPKVQFYCLMSVADCFTDFHIDFGGSSVFYHILKGKKTFLFIPPKEKHLKKYEEWCMSPAQNWTFLGDQTKECYRVDLSEGDTMLIPAGWIHAVWTPEDSLVIGGNFLTRMNFAMQLRVAEVEKATGVARKFRYPNFQKLQWYTALRYLEDDPIPNHVSVLLHSGATFHRERPTYLDFDAWGENSRPGLDNYHARYYSQSELEGLSSLVRYLLRTALIDIGSITDGISTDTRNAVKKAIPRAHGHGEPLEVVKTFAAWVAWKRGDEPIPHWAYPDAVPETLAPDKLSAAATKKLDREAALSAPRRQSARMQSQQQASEKRNASQAAASLPKPTSDSGDTPTGIARSLNDLNSYIGTDLTLSDTPKKPKIAEASSSHRKTACESCRKRRRACKHKDQVAVIVPEPTFDAIFSKMPSAMNSGSMAMPESPSRSLDFATELVHCSDDFAARLKTLPQDVLAGFPKPEQQANITGSTRLDPSIAVPLGRPRTKACNECRKSKRRCVHDIFGNEDPIKLKEVAIPRPHARKSHAQGRASASKPAIFSNEGGSTSSIAHGGLAFDEPALIEEVRRVAPVANMIARPPASETGGPHASSLAAPSPQLIVEVRLDPAPVETVTYESQLGTSRTQSASVEQSSLEEMDESCRLRGGKADMVTFEPRESYGQPVSSLVSPPASADDDAGHSPTAGDETWTSSSSSIRQSSGQPKPIQTQRRYTPESGPMRRASTSSYGEDKVENIVDNGPSPKQVDLPSSGQKSDHQRLRSDATMEPQPNQVAVGLRSVRSSPVQERLKQEDEDSLRLIKELQAQDYGLRRRGTGMGMV